MQGMMYLHRARQSNPLSHTFEVIQLVDIRWDLKISQSVADLGEYVYWVSSDWFFSLAVANDLKINIVELQWQLRSLCLIGTASGKTQSYLMATCNWGEPKAAEYRPLVCMEKCNHSGELAIHCGHGKCAMRRRRMPREPRWLGGLLIERRTSVSQIRGSIPRQVAAV